MKLLIEMFDFTIMFALVLLGIYLTSIGFLILT